MDLAAPLSPIHLIYATAALGRHSAHRLYQHVDHISVSRSHDNSPSRLPTSRSSLRLLAERTPRRPASRAPPVPTASRSPSSRSAARASSTPSRSTTSRRLRSSSSRFPLVLTLSRSASPSRAASKRSPGLFTFDSVSDNLFSSMIRHFYFFTASARQLSLP